MTTMLYVIRTSARSLSPARPRNGGVRFSPGSSQGSPVTFSEACEMTGTKCCKALFYWRYAESRPVISLHGITRHALGVSDVLAVCCGCVATYRYYMLKNEHSQCQSGIISDSNRCLHRTSSFDLFPTTRRGPPRAQESNLYGWNAGSSTAELMMHGMGRMSQP